MDKTKANYFIDIILIVSFIVVSVSAIILFFVPYAPKGEVFILGLDRHLWSSMHEILGFVFIGFGLLHFLLHWEWMISTTKSLFKEQEETKKL